MISEAVVLLAGLGSRLRVNGTTGLKPLMPVLGRPLISYVLDAIVNARIKTVYAVVGFESESLVTQLKPLVPDGLDVHFIHNPEWQKQNGISVLSAAKYLTRPFLLTMSDHLFDQSIIDRLLAATPSDALHLAVDYKTKSIFDLADSMKVRVRDDKIVAISKSLTEFDAIDTGLFVCPPAIFVYLERAKRNGDCSLADGVQLMADDGKARVVDIGGAWWQDIDTPAMLDHAEKRLMARLKAHVPVE